MRILVAGSRPWNRELYEKWSESSSHKSYFVGRPESLAEAVAAFNPDLIFFLHWSSKIPAAIHETYECIAFHMTDLPYGRGGSPLQHLIMSGCRQTVLSAFRVTAELDAGPVYLRRPLPLDGTAQQIYVRATELALEMIDDIAHRRPAPVPQAGTVTTFRRRSAADSRIPPLTTEEALYDFIRMLDAEGYPRANLHHAGFQYEFSGAELADGRLTARVEISRIKGGRE